MTEDGCVAGGGGWADSGDRREMEEEPCREREGTERREFFLADLTMGYSNPYTSI